MVILGMRDQVLSSDFIWLCSLCYTCYARCPQNVKFTEVMGALRNIAVREGYVHPSFLERVEEIDRFTQQLRHDMLMKTLPAKREKKHPLHRAGIQRLARECTVNSLQESGAGS